MVVKVEDLDLKDTVSNAYGETFYKAVNHLAFANEASEDIFNPLFNEYLEDQEALYVVIGTDSGLLKKYFETKRQHTFSNFLFIEFDEVLKALDQDVDTYESIEDKDKHIWTFNQDFDFYQLNRVFGSYVIRRRVHLIKSLAVMDSKIDSPYGKLWEEFEVAYSHYIRSELNSQSAKVFEEQRLLNLADNLIPAREMGEKLEGRDAIILGGGPTLDDAIVWVRENQDKLIIFAAARIAKRMEKEGILVDFFVTVDPFPWSFDNSKAVLSHSEYSILVHSFHAQRRLISQWKGLSCYLGQRFGWKEESDELNYDGPGPTVTNTALHIAATMGATRLFLSGIDFCYAKGQTHESTSVEAQHKDTVAHHGKAMLEDNAGNMTETGDDFYSAKIAMESMIRFYLLHKPNLEFISLGLHSAKMENVTYRPVESIKLDKPLKSELMDEIKVELTLSQDERVSLVTETLDIIKKQQKRFKKLFEISREGERLSEKVYDKKGQIQNNNVKKIKKLQKKVNFYVGQDGNFITSYQAAIFSESFRPIEDESAMTNEEVIGQLKAFFGGMKTISQALSNLIEQSIQRTELRLGELQNKILPVELFEQWKKWGEFGRSLQWREWHDTQTLDDKNLQVLNKAVDAFKSEFDATDHQYQKMLDQNVNNVSKILARANNAFAKNNLTEIETIIDHVAGFKEDNRSQQQDFLSLLKGMAEELKGNSVEAFNLYEPIQLPALRHLALKKMLPIAVNLEDYSVALEVLERLVKINLDYMLPYADMLKVLGNQNGAIEVLQMYLEKHPDKISVKNKLAALYIQSNQKTEAQMLISEVLEHDSNNTAALTMQEQLLQTTH
ncbi:6-hydroxymethylpterin diphosphokinase MptE-like protein [Thiomicrorhabdus indica]|uniref:6-hydroxymethylpterin diphosphokinase MptE-like protein n=1 Tax=Thiomicrorhabdus indica TaxID=2267253 RepID=UPI00102E0B43|nr:6-hydroxymethylpterin diphosphokinase MptE-like protein [Thiomicrorhabdus indica]